MSVIGNFVRRKSRRVKSKLKSMILSINPSCGIRKRKFLTILFVLLFILAIGLLTGFLQSGPLYPIDSPRLVARKMDLDEILEWDQFDIRLWEHLKKNHIIPPAQPPDLYRFPRKQRIAKKDNRTLAAENSVNHLLLFLFWNKTGGVFVEAGASDGMSSYTLIFEAVMEWTGLLIECHPTLLETLTSINRKAYIADVCLSKTIHPENGRLLSPDKKPNLASLLTNSYYFPEDIITNYTAFNVQTVPLYAIIAAVDFKEVDLLILNVQGLELDVIRNFPFDIVFVKVWVIDVEYMDINRHWELRSLMEEQGYSSENFWSRGMHFIFVHSTYTDYIPKQPLILNTENAQKTKLDSRTNASLKS